MLAPFDIRRHEPGDLDLGSNSRGLTWKSSLYILQTHAADLGVYAGTIAPASGGAKGLKPGSRFVTTPVKAVYSPSPAGRTGYLLYMQGAMLMAQPFDPDRLELGGEAHPIAELGLPADLGLMLAPFSASANGVLVYQNPTVAASQFVWFDRSGKDLGTLASVDYLSHPNFSPDGKQVVWVVAWIAGESGHRVMSQDLNSVAPPGNFSSFGMDGLPAHRSRLMCRKHARVASISRLSVVSSSLGLLPLRSRHTIVPFD